MKYDNVCIESFGYHLPKNIITSTSIERRLRALYERLKLPFGRLEMMTGIRERRTWDKGTTPSDAASAAGESAIVNSMVDRGNLDCLINASVCRDFLEPATASLVHRKLDLPETAQIFDISNACLGFINGMVSLANQIELRQVKCGLVVAGETSGPLMDSTITSLLKDPTITRKSFKEAFPSLTIGSGAVAVVLAHKSISKTMHRMLGGAVRTASEFNHLCQGDGEGNFTTGIAPLMRTAAETLMKRGCELADTTWNTMLHVLGWVDQEIDRIFCHQVGKAYRTLLYRTLGLDLSKDFSTLEYLGNIGSVSLPITTAIGIEKGIIKQGDKFAMLGIGSGLNCMMIGCEW
ncbi:3-oxoacyl-ACP synthase III [Planctomycetota bacterium]